MTGPLTPTSDKELDIACRGWPMNQKQCAWIPNESSVVIPAQHCLHYLFSLVKLTLFLVFLSLAVEPDPT